MPEFFIINVYYAFQTANVAPRIIATVNAHPATAVASPNYPVHAQNSPKNPALKPPAASENQFASKY